MQKFIVSLVGLLAVGAFFIFSYTRMNRSEKPDDLMLRNIEALAAGENEGDVYCIGSGSIVCPRSTDRVEHVYIFYSLPH